MVVRSALPPHVTLGVIWVLGISMIVLSLFVGRAPMAAGVFGAALIVGHGALDGTHADALGAFGPICPRRCSTSRTVTRSVAGHMLLVLYPLVPWVGVMTAGYALAFALVGSDAPRAHAETRRARRRRARRIRGAPNVPRAHRPARVGRRSRRPGTRCSRVLDCTKYPPSLGYLLVTLGPALLLLALFEATPLRLERLVTLGRAPLFYYVAHLYLAHLGAFVLYGAVYGREALSFGPDARPRFSLPVVYACTFLLVAALVPACRRFSEWEEVATGSPLPRLRLTGSATTERRT